jgi:2-oxo-4-hydroxy-4-carboxy--5-ureidoimidazoline (OHCU) decarboxylase
MRTTKNVTISVPPQQLREMERTARKENRTMSELMRETFRRYQLDESERRLLADPLRASHLAELKQVLGQLRQESKAKGLDKITEREIDAEVQAVRKQRRKKINAPTK